MPLTPKEEAMHLEVRALIELAPRNEEEKYIHGLALTMFFETNAKEILSILDQYLKLKSKEK